MLDGSGTIAFEWSFVGLALLFVLLRLYVRICYPESRHDWGDYIVVIAWLNFAACCACDAKTRELGFMRPKMTYAADFTKVNPDPKENIKVLKIIYSSAVPYLIGIWLVKAAILSFYYTIIPSTLPVYRFVLHIIAVASVITFIIVVIGNMFWCMPIERNWSLDSEKLCVASALFPFYGTVVCNIVTDLMIFCFPLPLLRRVDLPRRKMIGVIFVFMLGFLAILSSICRVIAISISSNITTVVAWSAVECSFGVIVACVPALRVLILRRERNPCRHSRNNKPYTGRHGPSILSAADRNEIWDGTDATAPQWIRMASLPSGTSTMVSPKMAQFDDSVDLALSNQLTRSQKSSIEYGSVMSDFSMVTPIPNIRLQIGRGIVEHASMCPSMSPTSAYFQPRAGNSISSTSPISTLDTSGTNFTSIDESDDTLPFALNRWDTGESGRLELGRIVDTAAGVNRPRSISVQKNGKSRLGGPSADPYHE